MEKRYKAILYILIILLIISGGALFLWRDDLINNLNEKTGIAALEVIVPMDKTSDDTLDTSVLSEAKFTSLKNNVVNFDFDSVCKEGGKRITMVTVVESVDNQTDPASAPAPVRPTGCVVGNSIPFPFTVKK